MSAIRAEVPARVHLAGNPSDGYGGAVLSTTIGGAVAHVTVEPARVFSVHGATESWGSLADLARATSRHGHGTGDRLVKAALVTLHRELGDVELPPGRFTWGSDIPRSVGLGGSSAIVLATMRAALRHWDADDAVTPLTLAQAALRAETEELGIAAGIADRTVQAIGGVVLTDSRTTDPTASTVPVAVPVPASLLWNDAAAAPSGDYHRELRRRVDAGHPETAAVLDSLASTAIDGGRALTDGDVAAFSAALDRSLELRRALWPVPPAALDGVDALRAAGAAVNFAGSGGALVVVGDHEVPAGFASAPIEIGAEPG